MPRKRLHENSRVLQAIQDYIARAGVPPTIEELRRALKVGSTRTIFRYLQELEKEGFIVRWSGARGLKTLRARNTKGLATIAVPLVGEAPAGPLMTAEQNIEGWIRLPKEFTKPQDAQFFILRVRGNSMNRATLAGERIENSDLVLVRQQATAGSGDIVVALIDDEVTIKRLVKGSTYWLLKPESTDPAHHPIVAKAGLRVQGVLIRVLKQGTELLGLTHVDERA